MLSIFPLSVGHLCVFLRKMSIQILCPFFNQIGFFLLFFCIFWILLPYQMYHLQISSPICLVAFLFRWWFLLLSKRFLVCYSPLHLFLLFYFPCLWCQVHKHPSETKVLKFSICVFFYLSYCFRSYIQAFNLLWVHFCVVSDSSLVSFFCMQLFSSPNTIENFLSPLYIFVSFDES